MDLANKWYGLSDQLSNANFSKDQAQVGAQGNYGTNTGLSALGFRGNQNAGSMERLGTGAALGQGSAGAALGQSKYNDLAKMYGQGMSQIEIPTLIGQEQASAQKNASNSSNVLGNFFHNLGL